jgi:tetratricopeptide (TPR) repeat protein
MGDARQWVEAAFQTLDAATPAEVRARLELSRARVMLDLEGRAEAAIDAAERAASCLQIGDLDRASACLTIGLALIQSERIHEGEARLRDALETARSCGAKSIVPSIIQALATARGLDGDLEGARVLSWEGLRLHRAAGCERLAARDIPNLAESEFAIGNAESALELALEAAAVFRAERTRAYLGWTLGNASVYLMALQRFGEARASAHEALTLGLESGLGYRTLWALQHLAALDTNHRRAAHLLGFVDARLAQSGVRREYTERYSYDRLKETLCNAFGPKLDELFAEGERWSQDRAIAEALEIL